MIEALCMLLSSLLAVLLTILEPFLEFFIAIMTMDESLSSRSRLREPPLAKEGRRFWRKCLAGFLVLILLGTATAAAAWWQQA